MLADRPTFDRCASLLLVLVAGCATGQTGAPPPADPRASVVDVSRARRVEDWKRLSQALASLPCKAIAVTGVGEQTSIVIAADCLFAPDGGALIDAARPVVAAIARELKQEVERDFWIASRPGAGVPGSARLNNARASAVVAALVANGVPPAHVAAIVGVGDPEEQRPAGTGMPAPDVALVEIIVAPDRDELGPTRR